MKQITENYCNKEISVLLKEKGFDELCIKKYNKDGFLQNAGNKIVEWQNSELNEDEYSAPTHQMAIAWILDKYNVYIEATALKHNYWVYTIYKIFDNKVEELYNEGPFKSHEDAVEAALKYTLENLI